MVFDKQSQTVGMIGGQTKSGSPQFGLGHAVFVTPLTKGRRRDQGQIKQVAFKVDSLGRGPYCPVHGPIAEMQLDSTLSRVNTEPATAGHYNHRVLGIAQIREIHPSPGLIAWRYLLHVNNHIFEPFTESLGRNPLVDFIFGQLPEKLIHRYRTLGNQDGGGGIGQQGRDQAEQQHRWQHAVKADAAGFEGHNLMIAAHSGKGDNHPHHTGHW